MDFLSAVADVSGPGYEDREIELPGGVKTFRFRKLLAGEAEALFGSVKKDAPTRGIRDRVIAQTVSTFVTDEAGEQVEVKCTREEAAKLTNEVCGKLWTAAMDVNGAGEKKSDPEDGSDSGTS